VRTLTITGLLAVLAGCADGGPRYADVSGRVTLNGEPLAGVSVDFQPVAAGKDADPGPGSTGKTDRDGRYTLRSQLDAGRSGAVVGKHQVRVWAPEAADGADAASGRPKAKKPATPPIPGRYHVESKLTFEVPAGGTAAADFALTSP
jgi:hypothetical protein